jgi:hypothetical protein
MKAYEVYCKQKMEEEIKKAQLEEFEKVQAEEVLNNVNEKSDLKQQSEQDNGSQTAENFFPRQKVCVSEWYPSTIEPYLKKSDKESDNHLNNESEEASNELKQTQDEYLKTEFLKKLQDNPGKMVFGNINWLPTQNMSKLQPLIVESDSNSEINSETILETKSENKPFPENMINSE